MALGIRPDLSAQPQAPADSLALSQDSAKHSGSVPFLDAEVTYKASDSLSFDFLRQKMYLYGDAEINYGDINLKAYAIELDMDSTLAEAYGRVDSLGKETGLPVFTDKSGEYEMRHMKYNFKTKKAIITHIVTEQGDGFVVGSRAKRVDEETYFMRNAHYTTCNHHDHPHYYLNLTKAKVIPGKKTITGPAYLVLEDVPIPIGIPFAIIPNTTSYSSGVIIPSYGDESEAGFYLRNGGYYWAANEYFDLRLLADIYTKGSWGAHVKSTYKKRYKFSGNIAADYIVNKHSEKDLPDYSETKDFQIKWSHSQDSKANPDQTFSASVNVSTSSYNKNNITSLVNTNTLSTNQKSSSISYSRKWPWNPFRLTASLLHSQNSRDTSISLTLPDIAITSSQRFYPFASKNKVGSKENFLQKINLSYSANMKNYISCKERDLSFSAHSLSTQWKNGIKHTLPVTTNIKMLKYFTLSPTFNYTERWYFSKTKRHWDPEKRQVVADDPVSGFNRAYDYSFSIGTSTKVYTFFKPIRALFGDKINAIRHVATPSVSLSYTPDFSRERFGFYDYFEYYDPSSQAVVKYKYSYYNGYIYGTPGSAESGKMSLSLGNTLEMKVKSDADSTGFRKISILESLSFSSGYDFLKDSMRWDNINMSGRTKIFGTNISFGANFDPYGLVASKTGSAIRINRSALRQNGRLVHLRSANMSFGLSFNQDSFKKKDGKSSAQDDDETVTDPNAQSDELKPGAQMDNVPASAMAADDDGYATFTMPWSLSLNYSLQVSQGKFNPATCRYAHKVTSSVNVNGNVALTPKWRLSMSTGYSFDEKKLSTTSFGITRDLHCWSMNFNMVPVGTYKSYSFCIQISSSILQDFKYEQSSSPRDNPGYY